MLEAGLRGETLAYRGGIAKAFALDLFYTPVYEGDAVEGVLCTVVENTDKVDLAVLFTSGYSEKAIVHGGRLDTGVALLGKPYTREQLARKVRHELTNQHQRNRARNIDPSSGAGSAGS